MERNPVIISKYSKSYDTADGSEQHFHDPTRRSQSDEKIAGERWEDDGGPARVQPSVCALDLKSKPAWSVLSLRDLTEAIRLEGWVDNPARLVQVAERKERARLGAIQKEEQNEAAAARAEKNRHRNPWENT